MVQPFLHFIQMNEAKQLDQVHSPAMTWSYGAQHLFYLGKSLNAQHSNLLLGKYGTKCPALDSSPLPWSTSPPLKPRLSSSSILFEDASDAPKLRAFRGCFGGWFELKRGLFWSWKQGCFAAENRAGLKANLGWKWGCFRAQNGAEIRAEFPLKSGLNLLLKTGLK